MKRGELVVVFIIFLLLSVTFVSAFSFVDFWEKITEKLSITGRVVEFQTPPTPSDSSVQQESSIIVSVPSSNSDKHSTFVNFDNSLSLWESFNSESAPGARGGAKSFDGVGSYSNLGTSNFNIDKTNEFTISLWFNLFGTNPGNSSVRVPIISRGRYIYPFIIYAGYNKYHPEVGWISSYVRTDNTYTTTTSDFNINEWNHVVITYRDGLFDTYLNGEKTSKSVNGKLHFGFTSHGDLDITTALGKIYGSESNITFNGSIDEVMIFNRALSSNEINSIYDARFYKYNNEFSNLAEGTHSFKAYTINSQGNIEQTETRTITIDQDALIQNITQKQEENVSAPTTSNETIETPIQNATLGNKTEIEEELESNISKPAEEITEEIEDFCEDKDGDKFDKNCGVIDCNDNNVLVNPNTPEICDSVDNNCDGQVDEGCAKDFKKCKITNVYWKQEYTTAGQPAELVVEGENCEGHKLIYTVYEKDFIGDDFVTSFVSSNFTTIWKSMYIDDIWQNPEYYIKIRLANDETSENQILLRVGKISQDKLPKISKFDGSTTKFEKVGLTDISNVALEKKKYGKIQFNAKEVKDVNFENLDLDSKIVIEHNLISVNSEDIPELNLPANLTLYDLDFKNPVILKDDKTCSDCKILSYNNGDLEFSVEHFSNYSAGELQALTGSFACEANTYYVDFENGNDANNGKCTNSSWKHSPGDPLATGLSKSAVLKAGDTIKFKGGVIYRGNIVVNANGINYEGDSWPGLEGVRAIIDGSELINTPWTKCSSQSDCGGNTNWQNIYYTALPSNVNSIFTPVYENDEFLWVSQDPNPLDWFNFDDTSFYRVIPSNDPVLKITRTSITDPRYFTQSDPNYWNGAYVGVYRSPALIEYVPITAYDPATSTITFTDIGGDLYATEYYTILNHLSIVDQKGEFYFDSISNRLYAWPYNNPATDVFSISRRKVGISAISRSNIIIEGFKIQKYHAGLPDTNQGVGIFTSSSSNIIIQNNEIAKLRSLAGAAAITLRGNNLIAENNYIHEGQRNIGIIGVGSNIKVINNIVSKTSRQGIWFMDVIHGEAINNTIIGIKGMHSNGLTVYGVDKTNCVTKDILFANNKVIDTNDPMTWHGNDNANCYLNLTIYNNLIIGADESGLNVANGWGRDMLGVTILNNLFFGGSAVGLSNSGDKYVIIKNNIISGMQVPTNATLKSTWVMTNNIYTKLAWTQASKYGWYLGTNEVLQTDTSKIFTLNTVNGNFNFVANSIAIDKGEDVSKYLPVSTFPDVDFTKDLNGNPRAQGSAWDIGPYEFVSGEVIPPVKPVCGNNIIESGEICDGTSLNNKTCITQGFASGTLSCLANCSGYNTNNCVSAPILQTCAEQFGDICSSSEICSGTNLTASDTNKCCSVTCTIPSFSTCNQCGDGLFNLCDKDECHSITQGCYYEGGLFLTCSACNLMTCDKYSNDIDCNADKCGLSCEWNGNNCVQKIIEQPPVQNITGINYYVRQGATGSNNGSDWTNAYATLPLTLKRGATYYIADGTYGSYTFDDAVNGTQYITIKKAIVADHGTNTGWQAGYGDGVVWFSGAGSTWNVQTSNWIFDGQIGSGTSGHGFKITTTTPTIDSKLVTISAGVDNLEFYHIEMQHAGTDTNYRQDCVYWISTKDNPSYNVIFEDCYMHEVNRVHMYLNHVYNFTLNRCYLYNQHALPGGGIHSESITAALGNTESMLNMNWVIKNNVFKDFSGSGAISPHDGTYSGCEIYNNIFYITREGYTTGSGVITGSTGDTYYNMYVHHNTFINIKSLNAGISFDNGANNYAYNNIWYNCPKVTFSGIEHDYNTLYDSDYSYGSSAGPNEITATGDPFVDWQNGNFKLKAATAPGKNLASPYNVDMLGNIRGGDGVWDRGAYEFVSGEVIPPVKPVCGNNIIESGEICDGTSLNSKTCVTQGFASGTLSCLLNCSGYNTNNCVSAPVIIINDIDNDGISDSTDNCPLIFNYNQIDTDSDGKGDVCDNCPLVLNSDQLDNDKDGVGNVCDNCLLISNSNQADTDSDTIGNSCDNCPSITNQGQADIDKDGTGNVCDSDIDGDGVINSNDNCPSIPNPKQEDLDKNLIGDVCEDEDSDGVINAYDCNDYDLAIGKCSVCKLCTQNPGFSNNTGTCVTNPKYLTTSNPEGCPYPKYDSFSPALTTNLTKTSLTNVSDVTLGIEGKAMIEFNQPVDIVKDINGEYQALDLDSNIIMEKNKITFNTNNLPELNVASWITFFNVSFKYPRILKDNVEYKDYLDLILPTEQNNYTLKVLVPHYTTYEIVEGTAPVVTTPESSGGSSGGGGGGGSSTTIIPIGGVGVLEFELNSNQIDTKIREGDTQTLQFVITNNKDTQLQVSLSSDSDRIVLLKNSVILNPGESKIIEFNVVSEENEETNIYLEKITLKSKDTQREVFVAVEVVSKDSLFDVGVLIANQSVQKGGIVSGRISLSKLMSEPMTEDVVINYIIKDKNGKVIVSEKETESVETAKYYIKDISLPKNLNDGQYVYYVQVNYQGKTASASAWFNVGKESGPTEYSSLLISIILVIIAISIILAFLIYKYIYNKHQSL